jgi:superfamily I DNA/RNA helicase
VSLNADQQAIVTESEGARCVIAGPGTGKTTTMVDFINQLRAKGVSASDIRCVTFSKEAAHTIENRAGVRGVFSTFHSLGYLICSETERKPVEPEKRHRLMFKLCGRWGQDYKELDQFISMMRRQNIDPQTALDSGDYSFGACRAYMEYERVRKEEGWMDFDSMLRDAVDLLERNRDARGRWQPRYLIVDEAQDTDDLQWRLMQLMSQKHGNITVVGDPNQAIYGFRGAKPENITDFQQWFPGGKNYYLGLNYRSTQTIVDFIRENAPEGTPVELLKRMTAARNVKGAPIGLKMYWSEDDEAESAIKLAQRDPLNSIILARTNRTVGLLERICNRHSIAYHLMGRTGFWKQNEIRKAVEAMKDYPTLSTEAAFNFALPKLEGRYAVDDRTDKDNDALENLKVLRAIGKDFKWCSEFTTYANKMMHRRNNPRGLSISTVHQAKGGEWKNVYIIGAKAGGFPHAKGDPLEEQRVYFVAISRAIDVLRLSFAGTPSPYLRRYLTEEVLDKLREKAEEVDRLAESDSSQPSLFRLTKHR